MEVFIDEMSFLQYRNDTWLSQLWDGFMER